MATYTMDFMIQRQRFAKWYEREKRIAERLDEGLPVDYTSPEQFERSKVKLIKSGNVLEAYEFQKPIILGRKQGGRRKAGEGNSEREKENRNLTVRRARNNIRRLVNANFNNKSKFITLTFADRVTEQKERHSFGGDGLQSTESIDIRNLDHTNKEFKKFVQRLRRYCEKRGEEKFKYIAVIEFQDENRNGVVHYHMMADFEYIPHEHLADLWGHGFVKINRVDNCDNVGAYLVKYLMKDLHDERLFGKKAYLVSRGLVKSQVLQGEEAHVELLRIEKENKKNRVYQDVYPSEYCGVITYTEYNMDRTTKKGYQKRIAKTQKINKTSKNAPIQVV